MSAHNKFDRKEITAEPSEKKPNCPNRGALITEDCDNGFCEYCGSKYSAAPDNVTNDYIKSIYVNHQPAAGGEANPNGYSYRRRKSTFATARIFMGIFFLMVSIEKGIFPATALGTLTTSFGICAPKKTNYCRYTLKIKYRYFSAGRAAGFACFVLYA